MPGSRPQERAATNQQHRRKQLAAALAACERAAGRHPQMPACPVSQPDRTAAPAWRIG